MHIISWLLVDRASELTKVVTLDRNDELWKDSQYLVWVSLHQLLCSLNSQEFIRLLSLSETFKENREIEMIVKVFGFQLPSQLSHFICYLSGGSLEAHCNWEISSVVVLSEECWLRQQLPTSHNTHTFILWRHQRPWLLEPISAS